jgi:tRNA(Arg) A34 adenosine deaminase TadA
MLCETGEPLNIPLVDSNTLCTKRLKMDENDLRFIRAAIDVARKARDRGDHPFGALLVDGQGRILMEAGNTVVTELDCTGHAETNLMRQASRRYDSDFLATCTLYTSTEPCPMCAGAIYWGNVRRVVYGLSQVGLYRMTGEEDQEVLHLPCRELFGKGRKPIEVIGPVLEEEARAVHAGFWS